MKSVRTPVSDVLRYLPHGSFVVQRGLSLPRVAKFGEIQQLRGLSNLHTGSDYELEMTMHTLNALANIYAHAVSSLEADLDTPVDARVWRTVQILQSIIHCMTTYMSGVHGRMHIRCNSVLCPICRGRMTEKFLASVSLKDGYVKDSIPIISGYCPRLPYPPSRTRVLRTASLDWDCLTAKARVTMDRWTFVSEGGYQMDTGVLDGLRMEATLPHTLYVLLMDAPAIAIQVGVDIRSFRMTYSPSQKTHDQLDSPTV